MNVRKTDTPDEIFSFLHGKEYTLDGIHGTFVYIKRQIPETAVHYAGWWNHTLEHQPSDEGKRSEAYQEGRRRLKDDWVSDMTDSDRTIDIALELGYGLYGPMD